jgi:hypothetical protein
LNNARATWQNLNSLIYNKPISKPPDCSLLLIDGISYTQAESIADEFNVFFCSIGQNNINKISINDIEFQQIISNEQYTLTHDFSCPQVTEDEICLVIDNLSTSASVDIYGVSNNFVKFHKNALAPHLAKLTNSCLFDGIFPDALKRSLVSVLHKSGNKTNPSNYRPISITPIFGKIFEYVILRRLEDHLAINNILHQNQFGAVKNSNTEITCAHILHDIYRSLDIRHEVSLTCIDIQKAYDSVKHSVLVCKLNKLRMDRFFVNLLTSYLTNRKQAVKFSNCMSGFRSVTAGLPQGGVLSGILFNLYVNSLFSLNLRGSLYCYCDDMSLINHHENIVGLEETIVSDLEKISSWLNCHYFLPNVSKTNYMLFGQSKNFDMQRVRTLDICFNNIPIERTSSVHILGLILDESLSFKEHVRAIQNKITSFSYALRRCRKYISDFTAISLYYAHVQSHFIYMCSIYCRISVTLMNILEVSQRKSLRVILKMNYLSSRSDLYSLRFLPVSVLCRAFSCLQIFKIRSNILKCNFPLNTVNQRHEFPTRTRDNFIVDQCRLQLCTQDFFIHALRAYNSLPLDIKQINSLNVMKNRLKEHYLAEYCSENNLNL